MKKLLTTLLVLLAFNSTAYDPNSFKDVISRLLNGEMSLNDYGDMNQQYQFEFDVWNEILNFDGIYGGNVDMLSRSGDGNVVGNGGGMSEGTFEYSYQILGRVVEDCLRDPYCLDEEHEYQLLRGVRDVFQQNIKMNNYIIFLDSEVHQNFFDDVNGRGPRTAMTGSKPMMPVFINTAHLYDALGAPRWDVGRSISLLVHELGHQTGELNDRYLDKIGQKVRRFLEADKTTLENKVNEDIVRVWMRNGERPSEQFELGVFWGGEERNLRDEVISNIKCPRGFDLDNYSFSNLHWDHLRYDDADGYVVPITLWMNLRCINHEKGLVAEYENLDYKILLSKGKNKSDEELKVNYFIERL